MEKSYVNKFVPSFKSNTAPNLYGQKRLVSGTFDFANSYKIVAALSSGTSLNIIPMKIADIALKLTKEHLGFEDRR